MSNNLIPLNQLQVPSYVATLSASAAQIKAMNAAAAVGTGGAGVNKISLKGGRFRLIEGGAEVMVLQTLSTRVALVRINDGINHTWYEKAWNPDEDAGQPDCSSDDGIAPRPDSPKPQSAACATCPRAVWGSKINPQTGAAGKECADTKRMAVMAPGQNGRFNAEANLYQLAVPAASLKDFGAMLRNLNNLPTPAQYNMVEVDISFDTSVSFPKLNFTPVRWLEPDEFQANQSRFNDEETKRVAGLPEAQTYGASSAPQATLANMAGQQPQQPQNVQQAQAQQQAPVQQQVQQQAPVQQVQTQVQQQAPAGENWGQPQQVQTQQAPAGENWGQPQQTQQPAVAQQVQAQTQVQTQQQAPAGPQFGATPGRLRGKAAPGKVRRTPAEMAEDTAADLADQQSGQQTQQVQVQPQAQVQQTQVQQTDEWGQPQQAQQTQVQQQAPAGENWGQPQQVQTQAVQQGTHVPEFNANEPFAGAGQQTGAPNQPGVMNDAAGAFAGWDDPQ